MEFKRHNITWTDEKVGYFWNFLNNYKPFQNEWFTNQVGDGILKFVSKYSDIKGEVLDYSAGKGFLSLILAKNYAVSLWGCDFSEEAVKYNYDILKNEKCYRGCVQIKKFPSAFKDNQFDMIFFIEAIEHLTDNYFNSTLNEINRILKPGGKIIVTTPNNEILEQSHIICPDCGCIFHRMQHIRSFNNSSLTEVMLKNNFNLDFCDSVNFFEFKKKTIVEKTIRLLRNIYSRKRTKPHLIFIGTKKNSKND